MSAAATPEADEIVERAMKLSEAEREAIALRLLDSIEPPPNAYESPDALRAELLRRVEAFERGEAKGYTHEEAMAKIRKAREDRES